MRFFSGQTVTRRRSFLPLLVAMSVVFATSAVATSRASAVARGRMVTYRGVSVDVPASWPVFDLSRDRATCALENRHAVYLGAQGVSARCPSTAIGRTESVHVEEWNGSRSTAAGMLYPTSMNGVNVFMSQFASTTHEFAVAYGSVVVEVSFGGDEHLADSIVQSVRVVNRSEAVASRSVNSTEPTASSAPKTSQAAGLASYVGKGFDTCGAPSTGTMSAWLSSPYRALGIYVGGANRACPDGNLSASWVATVQTQGWYLAPLYVGLQAPCVFQGGLAPIPTGSEVAAGVLSADDAVNRAASFGLPTGTSIYFDMEAYNSANTGCRQSVLTFLQAWTQELHAKNYLSGVYSSAASGIRDLANVAGGGYLEPDDVSIADWNNVVGVFGDPFVPDSDWANHQRIHQYSGGHDETYNGVTINIDSDYLDVAGIDPGTPATTMIGQFKTFNCNIRSAADYLFVTTELGYPASLQGALRARATRVGAWEKYTCVAFGSNHWAILSRANGRYVSAELGYPSFLYATLRARAATVGWWELYTFAPVGTCGSCFAIRAINTQYATADLSYPSYLYALLHARAATIGAWETYVITIDPT